MPCLEIPKDFLIRFYVIPIGSFIWMIFWVSTLVSTDLTTIPLLKIYIAAQVILSLFYIFAGCFLDRGLSIHFCGYSRYTISKRDLWSRFLEVDCLQRLVLLVLGSGWFNKSFGYWPFFVITREDSFDLSTLGHVIRAHIIISTFALVLSFGLLLDQICSDIKRDGIIGYMDSVNPSFWIRLSSVIWGAVWLASIWTHTVMDTYFVYAVMQMVFTLLYFGLCFLLNQRMEIRLFRWRIEIEPGMILLLLLVVDFIRRVVFICVGSLWFTIASPHNGMNPVELVLRHGIGAFTNYDFHVQSFLWHIVLSVVMLTLDFTMFMMIIYYIVADDTIERSLQESRAPSPSPKFSFSEIFVSPKEVTGICSICHDEHDETTFTTQVCGHSFHESCIRPWIDRHLSCPLCRSNLLIVISPAAHFDGDTTSIDLHVPSAV